MTGIARFSLVALDCPQPVELARFYAAITGWDVRGEPDDDDDWVQLVSPQGGDHRVPTGVAPPAAGLAER